MELPAAYLRSKTTIDEVLVEHTIDGVPVGAINDDWLRLLEKMREGDELWNFSAPDDPHAIRLWAWR